MTIEWLPPIEPEDLYPVHEYTVDLGEVEYTYTLTYQERQDAWYLDLYDADGESLLLGKRLTVNTAPLWRYRGDSMPAGQIVVVDTSGADSDPTYEDLGHRVRLAWVPDEDIPESTTDYDVTIEVT